MTPNDDLLRDLRQLVQRHESSRPSKDLATKRQMHAIIDLERRLDWKATTTERLIKSLFPDASRNNLTRDQANRVLRKMHGLLEDPPQGGTRLKVWDEPNVPTLYRFCGPEALPNTHYEPLSTTPLGVSAYRMLAVVDPSKLDEDNTIAVEDLTPPDTPPNPEQAVTIKIDDLTYACFPGVHDLLGRFEVVVDRFGPSLEVSIRSLMDQYIKSVEVDGKVALTDPHRTYFLWLEGQTTVWREDSTQIATLIGPQSYSQGGWGPANHPQPDLDLEFRTERHFGGLEAADRLVKGTHVEQLNTLGPWQPLGNRTGGGTGGGGITPYSAIGVSHGEIEEAWHRMKGVMHRSPTHHYPWGVTGPDIPHPEGQHYPYEASLIRYQRYDQAHASRALIDAMAVFWGGGSKVAGHWLRYQADVQGTFTPYSEEWHGKGHKSAHRALGWKAFNWALAASTCTTEEERRPYQEHCEVIARGILDVAMPSGITMRSGSQTNPGPFAAWMNPDIIAQGIAPDNTTLVRTFMQAIVAYGAYALAIQVEDSELATQLGAFISTGLNNVLGHDSSPAPKNHFVVGGTQMDSEIVDPYPVELDNGRCGWEMMFWCAAAYGTSQNPQYLLDAARIAGWDSLEEMLEMEYTRGGSNGVWWYRTPEIYAEVQQHLGT